MPEASAQPQTTVSKKVNWKKIAVTVVVVVVVTVLIAALIWFFVINRPESTSTEPIKVSTPSSKQATPSAKKDEAAESSTNLTKLYKDDFSNVSFKYPNNWVEKAKTGIGACEPGVGPKNIKNAGFNICAFYPFSSAEEVAGEPEELEEIYSVSMKKKLTVSGKSTIRQVVTKINEDIVEDTVYAYIDNVAHNNHVGTLMITGWSKGTMTTKEFVELFDKILSTFRFLPSTSSE